MTGSETEGLVALTVTYADLSSNAGAAVNSTTDGSSVTFDGTAPVFSLTSPAGDTFINTAQAGYTLSEQLASGSVIFTSTSGSDVATAYTYTLQTADMTLAATASPTALPLINGSLYTVSFTGIDLAGNPASRWRT